MAAFAPGPDGSKNPPWVWLLPHPTPPPSAPGVILNMEAALPYQKTASCCEDEVGIHVPSCRVAVTPGATLNHEPGGSSRMAVHWPSAGREMAARKAKGAERSSDLLRGCIGS